MEILLSLLLLSLLLYLFVLVIESFAFYHIQSRKIERRLFITQSYLRWNSRRNWLTGVFRNITHSLTTRRLYCNQTHVCMFERSAKGWRRTTSGRQVIQYWCTAVTIVIDKIDVVYYVDFSNNDAGVLKK